MADVLQSDNPMKFVPLLILTALLLGAPAAEASPRRARDAASTERFDPTTELLESPLTLELPTFQASLAEVQTLSKIELRLEELAPEALELRLDLHPTTTLYLAADLDADLPRLDALDGDTYFVVGVELHVTRNLRLFAEDFQPASLVVGDAEELELEPPPLRSWDGHQVGIGLRWAPIPRAQLEAAAIFHVLSATRRASSTGARVSIGVLF